MSFLRASTLSVLFTASILSACSDAESTADGGAGGDGGDGSGGEGANGGSGGQVSEPTPTKELFLTSEASDATPKNLDGFQGSWDAIVAQDPGAMVLGLEPAGAAKTSEAAESTLTTPWSVALLQSVSAPLAAQTLGGDLTWEIGVDQSAPGADYFTHLYLAVWEDAEVCVLAEWTESDAGHEWGLFPGGTPAAPVALEPCEVPEGARLVLELGYTSANDHSVSRAGTLSYGGEGNRFTFSKDVLFR